MAKTSLNLSPLLVALGDEAERLGVSFPALLTADLARYRQLAQDAAPSLSDWELHLLSHVLSGIEAHDILSGIDALPSSGRIVAEIESWCDGATDPDILRAGTLTRQVKGWAPLTIAGLLLALRCEP